MSFGITRLFENAESFSDQGRLRLAVEALEEARRLTEIPDRRAWASYNLGVTHWHRLGDGLAARREFLACISDFDTHGYGQRPMMRTMHANALENAMLCALSFDEFEDLGERLNALSPGVPILTELVPRVLDWRERGDSWSDGLFSFALSNYNRNDPQHDVGRYGEARSTYHLILTHRRELRLSQEDWRTAQYEFCALSMRMAADCMKARGGDDDPNSPEEFLPILTEAIPLTDEYLSSNTGDDDLKKVRRDLDEMVTGFRERWTALHDPSDADPERTEHLWCLKCRRVLARRVVEYPEFLTGVIVSDEQSTKCPKCRGEVTWQLGPDIVPGSGRGCLPLLLSLGFLAGMVRFWFI